MKKNKKGEVTMSLEEFGELAKAMKETPHCMNCDHCIYIGEGDSICDAMDEPVLVLSDWEATDDYFCCGSSEWEPM